MDYAVFCDFDGTIIQEDSLDEILRSLGSDNTWKEIEERWGRNEIGSRECLTAQFRSVRATGSDIQSLAQTFRVDAGFKEFVSVCTRLHTPLYIVSDGLHEVIETVLHAYDIQVTGIFANHLKFEHDNAVSFVCRSDSGGDTACLHELSCAHCKEHTIRTLLSSFAPTTPRSVYVGDGKSDLFAALKSDTVFAKKSLYTMLVQQKKNPVPFVDFSDITARLEKLVTE